MSVAQVQTPAPRTQQTVILTLALLAGAAMAVFLGVYGRVHDPSGRSLFMVLFNSTIQMKAVLGSVAVALAVLQVGSAARIYGKFSSIPRPDWLVSAHRVSGTLAFLATIPVAYHCLWALGFQTEFGGRIYLHSLVGCFFFGAFLTKYISMYCYPYSSDAARIARRPNLPGWWLPVGGGLVFASLVVVWFTSSLWYFTDRSFPDF
jgi:hypothetical protein